MTVSAREKQMNQILNFERILCPVAESHESDEGLRFAILIARSYGARLSVLTCYDGKLPDDEMANAMRAAIKRATEHSFVSSPGRISNWGRSWAQTQTGY